MDLSGQDMAKTRIVLRKLHLDTAGARFWGCAEMVGCEVQFQNNE